MQLLAKEEKHNAIPRTITTTSRYPSGLGIFEIGVGRFLDIVKTFGFPNSLSHWTSRVWRTEEVHWFQSPIAASHITKARVGRRECVYCTELGSSSGDMVASTSSLIERHTCGTVSGIFFYAHPIDVLCVTASSSALPVLPAYSVMLWRSTDKFDFPSDCILLGFPHVTQENLLQIRD